METGEKLNEWRKRKALSELINDNKYLFNSWRAILYTQKGKKIGYDKSWNSFEQFYFDMNSSYKKRVTLGKTQ